MRLSHILALQLAATPILAAGVPAQRGQTVPTRALGKAEIEYAEPFSTITGFRELPDGRVVVSDFREKTIQIIDMKGTRPPVKVGREGRGPGEWAAAAMLLAGRGDTTWLIDGINRRLLSLRPDGTTGTMIPLATAGSRMPARIPVGADRSGRFYSEGSPADAALSGIAAGATPSGGALQFADSVPIVRSDAAYQKGDTVAWLRLPKMSVEVGGTSSAPQMRMRGASPFVARDAWAVGPDGSVVVARVADYRIERFLPNGTRVVGEPIPYTRVAVTPAMKQEVVGAMQKQMGDFAGQMPAGFMQSLIDGLEWPEFKPPFQGGLVVAPDGRLWVPVSRAATTAGGATYDVIDERGRLVERVAFPAGTGLLGFSASAMYVIRTDADDLQYLQRHAR